MENHLLRGVYTDKEVVLLYNFDLIPSPFFYQKVMETCNSGYCFSLLNFRFHTFLHSSEMDLTSYRACWVFLMFLYINHIMVNSKTLNNVGRSWFYLITLIKPP